MKKRHAIRFTTFLLALVLTFSLCPAAFAAGNTVLPDANQLTLMSADGLAVINSRNEAYYYRATGQSAKIGDNIKKVVEGNGTAMVLKTDNALWGYWFYGTGSGIPQFPFFSEGRILLTGVRDVSVGREVVLVLKNDGTLLATDKDHVYFQKEAAVAYLDNLQFTTVDSGVDLLTNGGYVKNGQIYGVTGSDGSYQTDRLKKMPATDVKYFHSEVSIASSGLTGMENSVECGTSILLTKSGDVWTWGRDISGTLGNGGYFDRTYYNRTYFGGIFNGDSTWVYTYCEEPRKILSDVEELWVLKDVCYALKKDGTLWTWGDGERHTAVLSQGGFGPTMRPDNMTGYTPRKINADYIATKELTIMGDYPAKQFRIYLDGRLSSGFCNLPFYEYDELLEKNITPTITWKSLPAWKSVDTTMTKEPAAVKNAVSWALSTGITTGYSDGFFHPNDSCTRGQAATFLWRAQGCPEPKTKENPFTDVSPTSPFYKAILWAYENGITTGTTDTTFTPGGVCTNAHIVTFLWRAQGKPTVQAAGTEYYAQAYAWAEKNALLGDTGHSTIPATASPRANIVTFLYRIHG